MTRVPAKGGRANENEGQKRVGFDKRYPKQIKTWSQKVDLSSTLPISRKVQLPIPPTMVDTSSTSTLGLVNRAPFP